MCVTHSEGKFLMKNPYQGWSSCVIRAFIFHVCRTSKATSWVASIMPFAKHPAASPVYYTYICILTVCMFTVRRTSVKQFPTSWLLNVEFFADLNFDLIYCFRLDNFRCFKCRIHGRRKMQYFAALCNFGKISATHTKETNIPISLFHR